MAQRNAGGHALPPPILLDVYVHNLLSMKSFHGVLAGNVHEDSLKSHIGKVRHRIDFRGHTMLTLNTPLKDIKTDNVWLSKLIYSEVVDQDCYKLRKLMKLFTPQVMFDIGINVGITSLLAKQLWPHVQIIGFEVNKNTAACASLNLPNTDIEVAEVGYNYRAIQLVERFGYPDLLKIDCEGGEVPFFYDLVPDNRLEHFQVIVGEWHQWPARALLESAFKDMFFTKFNDPLPEIGPWHTFYAIRKTMPNAEDIFKIVCE